MKKSISINELEPDTVAVQYMWCNYSGTRCCVLIARKCAKMLYFSFHHRDRSGTEKRRFPAVGALAQRRRETHSSSLLTHRIIPAFITATIVPIRFPSSSAPLRLCVSARDLFHSDRRVSENTWIVTIRLVPADNSLIFINFMNWLRAKRTDSLTNRFFLLSIRPV